MEPKLISVPTIYSEVDSERAKLRLYHEEVESTSIQDLKSEIDDAMFDLFDLTEDEREVEDYLEVF